ncbi:MAG TPA: hypothetical protein VII93_15525 [Anaerolineales bacterium]
MTQPTADVLLRIERLLRIGKQEEAQALLVEYLKVNPSSARAWWLMSLTIPDILQQRDCLERVLRLDPEDELARERLEMLKNQPIPPPSVKPFTVLDLSDINEPAGDTPATPDWTAPGEAVTESDKNASTSEPAPAVPDWAASSEAVPESDRNAFSSELGQAMPDWITPSEVISESNKQASIPEPPPGEPLSTAPIPVRLKNKWWVLDILMAILAIILIVILAAYLLKQQQAQKKTKQEIYFQQQTLEVAQTLASMPLPTLLPTWTSSPIGTALPTATFSATPTFTPTLRDTLTGTPPPSGLVGP